MFELEVKLCLTVAFFEQLARVQRDIQSGIELDRKDV